MLRIFMVLTLLLVGCDQVTSPKVIKIPEQKVIINYKGLTVTQMKNGSYEVEAKEKIEILYFGATWCGPCQKMKAMFKDPEVEKELSKFDFKMIDFDKNPELSKKYKIRLLPTTIIESKGKRYEGGMTKKRFLEILSQVSS